MGARIVEAEPASIGAPHRVCAVARRWARGDSRWLRDLPESVGLQRADRTRAKSAVLLHEAGGCPGDAAESAISDAQYPDRRPDWCGRADDHGPRLRGGVHA